MTCVDGVVIWDMSDCLQSDLLTSMNESSEESKIVDVLSNVYSCKTVRAVGEYMRFYREREPPEIPKPLVTSTLKLDKFSTRFLEMYENDLGAILFCANYLSVVSLVALINGHFASKIKRLRMRDFRRRYGKLVVKKLPAFLSK